MQRITANEVELTDDEIVAARFFDELLSEGHSCIKAGIEVVAKYPDLDAAFIDYLVS